MTSRSVATFGFTFIVQRALMQNGFRFVSDFDDINEPAELATLSRLALPDATEVFDAVKETSSPVALPRRRTAAEIYRECLQPTGGRCIRTRCRAFDDLFTPIGAPSGNQYGLPVGQVVEVYGAAGVGKSQLCIQLAISVQLPVQLGGLDGLAMYLDIEGSVRDKRVNQIAMAALSLLDASTDGQHDDLTLEQLTDGLHLYRINELGELIGYIDKLDEYINANPTVRLIIVDSIAALLRSTESQINAFDRLRIMTSIYQKLRRIAETRSVAVLVINQVTSKISNDAVGNTNGSFGMSSGMSMGFGVGNELVRVQADQVMPALGEGWGHLPPHRISLEWHGQDRYATVTSSPSLQIGASRKYTITSDGLADI